MVRHARKIGGTSNHCVPGPNMVGTLEKLLGKARMLLSLHSVKKLHDSFVSNMQIKDYFLFGIDDQSSSIGCLGDNSFENIISALLSTLSLADLTHIHEVLYIKKFVTKSQIISQLSTTTPEDEAENKQYIIAKLVEYLDVHKWNHEERNNFTYCNYYCLKALYHLNRRAYMLISNIIFNMFFFKHFYNNNDMQMYISPIVFIYAFALYYADNKQINKGEVLYQKFISIIDMLFQRQTLNIGNEAAKAIAATVLGPNYIADQKNKEQLNVNLENMFVVFKSVVDNIQTVDSRKLGAYKIIGNLKANMRESGNSNKNHITSAGLRQLRNILWISCDIVQSLISLDIIKNTNCNTAIPSIQSCLPKTYPFDTLNTNGNCQNIDSCKMLSNVSTAKQNIIYCLQNLKSFQGYENDICNHAIGDIIPFFSHLPAHQPQIQQIWKHLVTVLPTVYLQNNRIGNSAMVAFRQDATTTMTKSDFKPTLDNLVYYTMRRGDEMLHNMTVAEFKTIMALAAVMLICPSRSEQMIENISRNAPKQAPNVRGVTESSLGSPKYAPPRRFPFARNSQLTPLDQTAYNIEKAKDQSSPYNASKNILKYNIPNKLPPIEDMDNKYYRFNSRVEKPKDSLFPTSPTYPS